MPLALLSATLIAAAPVHLLEQAPTTFEGDRDESPEWYGWEPLLADTTAGVLFFGGLAFGQQGQTTAQNLTTVASVVIYGFGGPLLHWGRAQPTTALIDLGVRVGMPVGGVLLGIVLGVLTSQSTSWILPCFVLGFVVASITDIAALSWDTLEGRSWPEAAVPSWTPFVGEVRGAAVAGLAGRF